MILQLFSSGTPIDDKTDEKKRPLYSITEKCQGCSTTINGKRSTLKPSLLQAPPTCTSKLCVQDEDLREDLVESRVAAHGVTVHSAGP